MERVAFGTGIDLAFSAKKSGAGRRKQVELPIKSATAKTSDVGVEAPPEWFSTALKQIAKAPVLKRGDFTTQPFSKNAKMLEAGISKVWAELFPSVINFRDKVAKENIPTPPSDARFWGIGNTSAAWTIGGVEHQVSNVGQGHKVGLTTYSRKENGKTDQFFIAKGQTIMVTAYRSDSVVDKMLRFHYDISSDGKLPEIGKFPPPSIMEFAMKPAGHAIWLGVRHLPGEQKNEIKIEFPYQSKLPPLLLNQSNGKWEVGK